MHAKFSSTSAQRSWSLMGFENVGTAQTDIHSRPTDARSMDGLTLD